MSGVAVSLPSASAALGAMLIAAFMAVPAHAAEEETPESDTMSLDDALAEMATDGLMTVEAPAEGFPTYQYGDDPTGAAQLDLDHATVTSASAGIFVFGDDVTLSCDSPAALCDAAGAAPNPDEVYIGMSMSFASDIPVDGDPDGRIINYSFPYLDPNAEPFVELDAFPGDTWQDMNRVVVAEAQSPFTARGLGFTPDVGWAPGTTAVFGTISGERIWVFVPFWATPDEIEDIHAAIGSATQDGSGVNSAELPQHIADMISRGRWSVAVHVHQGDFGRDLPSTITAIPGTPRPPGGGLAFLPRITLLGTHTDTSILEPLDPFEPAAPEPAETPETPAVDGEATDPASDGNGVSVGLLATGVAVVAAGVGITVGAKRRKRGEPDPFAIPEGGDAPPTQEWDYVRDDGTHVVGWGVPMHASNERFEYRDGTVRTDRGGLRSRDTEIIHPDESREVWSGSDVRNRSGDKGAMYHQDTSYTHYAPDGSVIVHGTIDDHPWPDDG